MLMKVSALRTIGGHENFKNILAEDYAIGREMSAAGLTVALCKDPLPVVVGTPGFQGFFNRHVRWGQMRRHISPVAFLLELPSNPTPLFMGVLLFGQQSLWPIATLALVLKWLGDLQFYYQDSKDPSLRSATLLPLRDLIVPILWAVSAVSTRVSWRGNALKVGAGSLLSPLVQKAELDTERTLAA
jgi:ceramide glucosyltransferase